MWRHPQLGSVKLSLFLKLWSLGLGLGNNGGGSNFTKAYVYVYRENLKKKIFSQKLLACLRFLD